MSSSRRIITALVLVTALAMGMGLSARSEETPRRRGRPIQFSEPRSDVVKSNANLAGPNKATLRDLEQELKKPFELLAPADNLSDRIVTPPEQRAAPSGARARQMKNLLEKRNQWIFLEPEDYFETETTAHEGLDLSDDGLYGRDKKRKTPMERYYEGLARGRADPQAGTNQAAGSDSLSPQSLGAGLEEEDALKLAEKSKASGSGRGDMAQPLKPVPLASSSGLGTLMPETAANRSLADIFGFGFTQPSELSPEKSRAMETRLEEFKQLLGMRPLGPANHGENGLAPLISPPPAGASATPSAGWDGLFNDNAQTLSKPPLPTPSGQGSLPGLAAPSPSSGSTGWERAVPAPEPPPMTLPAPTFNVPQRKF